MVKRRHRIRRPWKPITVRLRGAWTWSVSNICLSPAVTGDRPVNGRYKRIFFWKIAILDDEKD
jgi:hypothetical protein